MKKKNGFTLVEVIVSFVLIMVVMIYLLRTIISISNKNNELLTLQEYNTYESTLLTKMYEDIDSIFESNNFDGIDNSTKNEILFLDIDKTLKIDEENNAIIYDDVVYKLPEKVTFRKVRVSDSDEDSVYELLNSAGEHDYYILKIYVKVYDIDDDIDIIYQNKNAHSLKIIFDGNGGTPSQNVISRKIGQKLDALPSVTRRGYTFLGWYTQREGGSLISSPNDIPDVTYDLTYYAHWNAKTYILTLDNKDATTNGTDKIYGVFGSGIYLDSSHTTLMSTSENKITIPIRTGYTFTGYYTSTASTASQMIDNNGFLTPNLTSTTYSTDHTLTARWGASEYVVTFNVNGGNAWTNTTCKAANGGTYSQGGCTKKVYYSSIYGQMPTPTRDGYVFDGWYTTRTSGTHIESSTTVETAQNHTLYAHWKPNKVKITINKDGSKWTDFNASSDVKISLVQNDESRYVQTSDYASVSNGVLTYSGVVNGTYDVYASIDSNHISTLRDTNIDVSVSSNDVQITINFYTLTIVYDNVNSVKVHGSTIANNATVIELGEGYEHAINSTVDTGYYFQTYQRSNANVTFYNNTKPSTNFTMTGKCTVTARGRRKQAIITINKDNDAYSNFNASGMKIALYDSEGTNQVYSYSSATVSGNTVTFNITDNGTYKVFASLDSNHASTLRDSNLTVTINDNSSDITLNYYTLTVKYDNVSDVTVHGTTISNNSSVIELGEGVTHAINSIPSTGYYFQVYLRSNANVSFTDDINTTASTSFTMSGKCTLTAKSKTREVTIAINKDGASWENSNIRVILRKDGQNKYSQTATSSVVSFSEVATGTYDVYVSKDAVNTDTFIDTGIDVNSISSVSVNYYTLTVKGPNVKALSVNSDQITAGNSVIVSQYTTHTVTTTGAKTGYTWNKWIKNSGKLTFNDANNTTTTISITGKSTITANAIVNKVYVKYNVNTGTLTNQTTSDGNVISTSGSLVTVDGSVNVTTINYGGSLPSDGLINYNNQYYVNITKTGYHAKADAEWNTKADGTGKSYSQATVYNASDFCSAASSNCEVELFVNWVPNKVYVKLHVNGGTLKTTGNGYTIGNDSLVYKNNSNIMHELNYNESLSSDGLLNYNNHLALDLKNTGYYVKSGEEWNSAANGSGTTFNQATSYTASQLCPAVATSDCTATLYVKWVPTKIYVKYNMNGGYWAGSTESRLGTNGDMITYDGSDYIQEYSYGQTDVNLSNYDNPYWINIKKTGYEGKTGAEWKKSDNTTLNQDSVSASDLCDASNSNCTVTLYVNWVEVSSGGGGGGGSCYVYNSSYCSSGWSYSRGDSCREYCSINHISTSGDYHSAYEGAHNFARTACNNYPEYKNICISYGATYEDTISNWTVWVRIH